MCEYKQFMKEVDTMVRFEPLQTLVDGNNVIDCGTGEVTQVRATRPLLYISGPMFSEGNILLNVRAACLAASTAYKMGWAPVVPHLNILEGLVTGNVDRERYMDVDLSLLRACGGLLLLEYHLDFDKRGQQTGTSEELDFAASCKIPIYTVTPLTLPWIT